MFSNTTFLFAGPQLYVFGGKNEEQDLNDLKVMKLINPSERQPGTLTTCPSCLESTKYKNL